MKRFYKKVEYRAAQEGYQLLLDGRSVKTPTRADLIVPNEALAASIADEWDGQGENIDPRSMPMTGLANAAIDRIAPEREAFAQGLSRYAESDLLCYRADAPEALVRRQAGSWDPILAWARRRFDIDFIVTSGIIHRPQPEESLRRLSYHVAVKGPFELAGLSPLVTISGSLIIALALDESAASIETGWAAAIVDETWQAERWGEDAEAKAALDARRRDFENGYRFLKLL